MNTYLKPSREVKVSQVLTCLEEGRDLPLSQSETIKFIQEHCSSRANMILSYYKLK